MTEKSTVPSTLLIMPDNLPVTTSNKIQKLPNKIHTRQLPLQLSKHIHNPLDDKSQPQFIVNSNIKSFLSQLCNKKRCLPPKKTLDPLVTVSKSNSGTQLESLPAV